MNQRGLQGGGDVEQRIVGPRPADELDADRLGAPQQRQDERGLPREARDVGRARQAAVALGQRCRATVAMDGAQRARGDQQRVEAVRGEGVPDRVAQQDAQPAGAVDHRPWQQAAEGELLARAVVDLRDAVRDAFAAHRLDALLVPASPLGAIHRDGRPAPLPDGHGGLSGASYIASLTGQPAVVLPLLRGPEPLGVQLVGRPWADDALLDVAAVLEGALAQSRR